MYDERLWRVLRSSEYPNPDGSRSWATWVARGEEINRIALPRHSPVGTLLIIEPPPGGGGSNYVAIPWLSGKDEIIVDRRPVAASS